MKKKLTVLVIFSILFSHFNFLPVSSWNIFIQNAEGRTPYIKNLNSTLVNKNETVMRDGKSIYYKYDQDNRLIEIITDMGNFVFTYDSLGRRTKLIYPNGAYTTYGYDSVSWLTSLTYQTAGNTVINSFTYAYDKVGNVLVKMETGVKQAYSYDKLYRVIQTTQAKIKGNEKEQKIRQEIFTYDSVGNRITGPKAQDYYSYNQGGQLVSDRRYQYKYDGNGNLISKVGIDDTGKESVWTYSYDYENRLIKVVKQESDEIKTITLKYDPFGNRIEKRVEENKNGRIETKIYTYVYDDEDIILETLSKIELGEKIEQSQYIHGPGIDEPLALIKDGDIYYYQTDGLGSVISLSDSTGRVVQRYEYDSFGNIKQQGNKIKQPYAFTGREWDEEIGLYYFRARYYDPKIGRFITKDPSLSLSGNPNIPFLLYDELKTPQGLNPYTYAKNNPINWSDPSGLFAPAIAIGACLSNLACASTVFFLGAAILSGSRNFLPPGKCDDKYSNACDKKFQDCLINGWRLVITRSGKVKKERIECSKCYIRCKTEGNVWPMDQACGF